MSRPLDLDLLTPGCEVWTSLERQRDSDGMPVGGIVLEVQDYVDAETGEVARRYRCLDTHRASRDHLAVPVLSEADLDPDSFRPPSRSRLSYAIRRLCMWIEHGRGRERRTGRMGALNPEEVQWAHWVGVLAHAIEQREITA
jgi:hypothetical protein